MIMGHSKRLSRRSKVWMSARYVPYSIVGPGKGKKVVLVQVGSA